jgi:hypothetical protein
VCSAWTTSLRRGHVYATVLADLGGTGRPIDVLADRTAGTLAAWLREHPGVEVICRDRAGAYAEEARTGAPKRGTGSRPLAPVAQPRRSGRKTVIACRGDLADPPPAEREDTAPPATLGSDSPAPAEGRLVVRIRERHAAVRHLLDQGRTLSAICRDLDLDRKTVQRFARASSTGDLRVKARHRGGLLDPFKPYLHERFNAGHTDAARLTADITALRYRGNDKDRPASALEPQRRITWMVMLVSAAVWSRGAIATVRV